MRKVDIVPGVRLVHADMFDVLPLMRSASVSMIFADFPYGTTRNKWDTPVDLAAFWKEAKRIRKPNAATVCTAQVPFSITLGASNIAELKYEWVWKKERGTGHLNAKRQPQKDHENVLVFHEDDEPGHENCMVFYAEQSVYNPQMKPGKPYTAKKGGLSDNYNKDSRADIVTVNTGERYPTTVIEFARDRGTGHSTAKPVDLLAYLINTYTNPGDTVVDPCFGSCPSGDACIRLGRRFIGIERDASYFDKAVDRLRAVASK